jgi:hypothetical protein
MSGKPVLLAMTIIGCLVAGGARADVIAFNDVTGHSSGNSYTSFLGYQFTTTQSLTVTELGILDVAGNAQIENHYVGLFASDGTTLLAHTTVTAGQTAPAGTDIFNSVSPVTLAPGTYDIGAFYSANDYTDLMIDSNASFTAATGISWDEALDNIGTPNADNYSTISFASNQQRGFFGPNFEFSPAPEPASLALLGLGVAAVVRLRRGKRDMAA